MAQTSCMTHTQYVQASHYVNKSVTGVDQVLHLCLLYLSFGSTALDTIIESTYLRLGSICSICNPKFSPKNHDFSLSQGT